MSHIYDDSTESLLFVDAENAFNVLNRKAALHHISVLCPVMSIILKNTYGGTADLYVSGEILIGWRNHAGRPPGNEYARSGHNATNTIMSHNQQEPSKSGSQMMQQVEERWKK